MVKKTLRYKCKNVLAFILAVTVLTTVLPVSINSVNADTGAQAENDSTYGGLAKTAKAANPQATLTVDMDPKVNTGEIKHGASGFLYGISNEDVPTVNTLVPLKSKILATKGAVGTEHPYGDALDVAKTFLESGGEQIQMYNQNYYGGSGPKAKKAEYCDALKNYICPAVVAWKEAWNEEHGTPENPKDNIGARVDIDKAIAYAPINEGGVHVDDNVNNCFKAYYDTIKEADPNATIVGINKAGHFTYSGMVTFLEFCKTNNCMPDQITWHELEDTSDLADFPTHMSDYRKAWDAVFKGTDKVGKYADVCINEYLEAQHCGVPGRLVNWISVLEKEKVTGCLPFWHQANNLNDLASNANEGNGAWWLYKWYGDMHGNMQPVKSSTAPQWLNGIATMDEDRSLATTLLGGFDGDINLQLNNVTKTDTFNGADKVRVKIQVTHFTGFRGTAFDTPTYLEGVYPVDEDGSVKIKIEDAMFSSAYNVSLTPAGEDDSVRQPVYGEVGTVYEAEDGELGNGAALGGKIAFNEFPYPRPKDDKPWYFFSSDGVNEYRAVKMPQNATLTYTFHIPADGRYKLDFNYANGAGSMRNDTMKHKPINIEQTFALDNGEEQTVLLENTLYDLLTGTKTLYYDLKAGVHTITARTIGDALITHDFMRVTYAGVYSQEVPAFNKVYEAELADINCLLGNEDFTVSTQTDIKGYSGSGYVTGLNLRSVAAGGGIRNVVAVEESGLYNITLRYQSDAAGEANIYVGNTAVTLDRLSKTVSLQAGEGWQEVDASVYLQKGINIIDLDMKIAGSLDYMRVRALPVQDSATIIEAEDAIPGELADVIKIAESSRASGGKYIEGMEGAYRDPNYLEFTYNAPTDGKYQMQAFHSNDDICSNHEYNIKITDKYAMVEVNGESNSLKFDLLDNNTYYFVDCGDHDPTTISEGDEFGLYNSVTDQVYGEDTKKGYRWGLITVAEDEVETPGEGSKSLDYSNDKAIYTNYQKANSNTQQDLEDGKDKETTFRYAHNQTKLASRNVAYKFELESKKYSVTVGLSNTWGNVGAPSVNLSAAGGETVSKSYSAGSQTMMIDLTDADVNEHGKVELTVKGTTSGATVQMTHIVISDALEDGEETIILPPNGQKALAGDKLPGGIYTGQLTTGFDWFIDYRNLKNETDRYFFINTFCDENFNEKTITLDLKKGENTIRIFNDNSWNITYGTSTTAPGTTTVTNYTPNFDKFIITPISLDNAASLTEEYKVDVVSTKYGIAFTDKNTLGANEACTITMVPEAGKDIVNVLVNGVEQRNEVTFDEASDTYRLTVSGVTEDQTVQVYFDKLNIPKETLETLYNENKDLEKGSYSTTSWEQFDTARSKVKLLLDNEEAGQAEINSTYEEFLAAVNGLVSIENLMYFVDCGDHNPKTVTYGDDLGFCNSVTDQLYGVDNKAGYSWGVLMIHPDERETPGEGSKIQSDEDGAAYTNYQKARSDAQSDLIDGQPKEATFRYAHNQDKSGISPRYVAYKFEVDPGKYDVTVGMSNIWNNAGKPVVTLSAEGVGDVVSESYTSGNRTMRIDLIDAETNENGMVELIVKGTTTGATLQMTYISVERVVETSELVSLDVKPPTKTKYLVGEELDTQGIKVKAVYSNGIKKDVNLDDCILEGYNKETVGDQTVTVSYTENEKTVTDTFGVVVEEEEPNPEVSSLEVEPPVKTKYLVGEELDTEGIKIKAVYSDGQKKDVKLEDCILSGYNKETVGNQTVTVSYTKNEKTVTGTFKVVVEKPQTIKVESVTLKPNALTLDIQKSARLFAQIMPANAANKTVTWESSNPKVATVNNQGIVTAVSGGTAVITVITTDGGKKAQCVVTVKKSKYVKVSKITTNMMVKYLRKGKKVQLKATVSPANASDRTVTWKSSNTKVAVVTPKGNVTAKKNGSATITATAGGKTAKVKIKIGKKYISVGRVKLSKKKLVMNVKGTYFLRATVTPRKASYKSLVWRSGNRKVVTVNKKGKLIAKGVGKTTITVVSKESGRIAKCRVTVKDTVKAG